jgi:hypothetical protein
MSSDTSTGIRTVTIKDRQKTCRTCSLYDPSGHYCCGYSRPVSDPDVDGYVCNRYIEQEQPEPAEAELRTLAEKVPVESDRLYVQYFLMTQAAELLVRCLKSGRWDQARDTIRIIQHHLDEMEGKS